MCFVAEPKTPRIPREQKFWLVIHWFALLQTVYLFGTAITHAATASEITIVTVATVATALAVYFAMRLARRRISTQLFIKWTTSGRVIAVGWSFIGLVLFAVPVVSVLTGVDLVNDEWTGGFLGTIGSVSFLAMVGPGYSDFREALAHAKEPDAA